jgi:O-antigen ligase
MKSCAKIDAWLFTLFAMPLFVATLSTVAATVFGALFLITYAVSGYWKNWRQVLSRTWFWPLIALLSINVLGMLWTQDTIRGLELLVKLKWALFALAGATLPWDRSHFILVVRLFLTGMALNAMIGGLQWLNLFPWRVMPTHGPIGYTGYIFLGMTLTNALMWIAYDLKHNVVFPRALNIALALIFFWQLSAGIGRAGHLAFVMLIPVALWLLYNGRWRAWAMAVMFSGIVGLGLSAQVQHRIQSIGTDIQAYQAGNAETSLGLRLVFWEGALLMAKESPIFGVGTGDYKIEMERLHQLHAIPDTPSVLNADHAHNSYLTYLADLGLTGLCIFFWFLWAVIKETWQYRESASGWFKLTYLGIFLLGSLSDTLIWGFQNAFALGLIVAIPSVLKPDTRGIKRTGQLRFIDM